MAKWERYIIYPLLFVALFFGVARETRILQAAESVIDEIRARRVVVVDEAGREQVVLRGARENQSLEGTGGQIEIFNGRGEEEVKLGTGIHGGIIWINNLAGRTNILLMATEDGGRIALFPPVVGDAVINLQAKKTGGIVCLSHPFFFGRTAVELSATENGGVLHMGNPKIDWPLVNLSSYGKSGQLLLGDGSMGSISLIAREDSAELSLDHRWLDGNRYQPYVEVKATEDGGWVGVFNKIGRLQGRIGGP